MREVVTFEGGEVVRNDENNRRRETSQALPEEISRRKGTTLKTDK